MWGVIDDDSSQSIAQIQPNPEFKKITSIQQITWCGLPSNAHRDLDILKRERDARLLEVEKKRETLKELVVQQIGFKRLCERNRLDENSESDKREVSTSEKSKNANSNSNTGSDSNSEEKIHLPFIVVNTSKNTIIQCEMGTDR